MTAKVLILRTMHAVEIQAIVSKPHFRSCFKTSPQAGTHFCAISKYDSDSVQRLESLYARCLAYCVLTGERSGGALRVGQMSWPCSRLVNFASV